MRRAAFSISAWYLAPGNRQGAMPHLFRQLPRGLTMNAAMRSHLDSNAFSVRRADWVRDCSGLRYVRTLVFIREQAVPADLEWDEEDAHAVHLLAVNGQSRPIGTVRLQDTGQIGRMAVLPDWRNRGIGNALMREILDIARDCHRFVPFLNAQLSALPFYQRAGFEAVGDEFLEAGIPHRRMVLRYLR